MALDDPQSWEVYRQLEQVSQDDPLVHAFTNLTGVGNVEVNAFQRLSDVCVQKSVREGFGLVVSETLWKGTPMVAGRAGGIPLQLADGAGGLLVETTEECAAGTVELLREPERAADLAERGRERVREHFLLPRLLLDELELIGELVGVDASAARRNEHRDPVCGMAVVDGRQVSAAVVDGTEYLFCSNRCRDAFQRDPDRYLVDIA
jgi:trehalose synthase